MSKRGSGNLITTEGKSIPSDAVVKVGAVVDGIWANHNITLGSILASIDNDSADSVNYTEIYVDGNGDDSNEGTRVNPLRTLNKALALAREIPRESWVAIRFNPRTSESLALDSEPLVFNRQRTLVKPFFVGSNDFTSSVHTIPATVPSVYVGNATFDSYLAWDEAGGATFTYDGGEGQEAYAYTGQTTLEDGGILVRDTDWIDNPDEDNSDIYIQGLDFDTQVNAFFVVADNTGNADIDLISFDGCYFNGGAWFSCLDSALFKHCAFQTNAANKVAVFDNCSRILAISNSGFSSGEEKILFRKGDGSAYQGQNAATAAGLFLNERSALPAGTRQDLGFNDVSVIVLNDDASSDMPLWSVTRSSQFIFANLTIVGRVYGVNNCAVRARDVRIDRRDGVTPQSLNFLELVCDNLTIVDGNAGDPGVEVGRLYVDDTLNVDDADTAGNVSVNAGWLYVGAVTGSAASVTVNASAL